MGESGSETKVINLNEMERIMRIVWPPPSPDRRAHRPMRGPRAPSTSESNDNDDHYCHYAIASQPGPALTIQSGVASLALALFRPPPGNTSRRARRPRNCASQRHELPPQRDQLGSGVKSFDEQQAARAITQQARRRDIVFWPNVNIGSDRRGPGPPVAPAAPFALSPISAPAAFVWRSAVSLARALSR